MAEGQVSRVKFILNNMGLNEYQASALSQLLYLGETKATTLSKASGVPSARIYGILDGLSKRGLVTIRPGRPLRYSPVTPREISSALISDAREEIRNRLRVIESFSEEFIGISEEIFLKAGEVNERTPLLRIVSVGDASMQETMRLYKSTSESLRILTRAMEYYDQVAQVLKEITARGVKVKILMMSDQHLSQDDRGKRDDTIKKIRDSESKSIEIRLTDEVNIRGCIVDADSGGSALFLVEEVGVPYFLREAAITTHPGVVKGLRSMFDLIWDLNSQSI